MGNMIRKVLWLFFVGCVLVIVLRNFPWQDPASAWAKLEAWSGDFAEWIRHLVAKFNIGDLPKPNPIQLDK